MYVSSSRSLFLALVKFLMGQTGPAKCRGRENKVHGRSEKLRFVGLFNFIDSVMQ